MQFLPRNVLFDTEAFFDCTCTCTCSSKVVGKEVLTQTAVGIENRLENMAELHIYDI